MKKVFTSEIFPVEVGQIRVYVARLSYDKYRYGKFYLITKIDMRDPQNHHFDTAHYLDINRGYKIGYMTLATFEQSTIPVDKWKKTWHDHNCPAWHEPEATGCLCSK